MVEELTVGGAADAGQGSSGKALTEHEGVPVAVSRDEVGTDSDHVPSEDEGDDFEEYGAPVGSLAEGSEDAVLAVDHPSSGIRVELPAEASVPATEDSGPASASTPSQADEVWKILERVQGRIAAELREMLGEPPYDQSIFDDEQQRRRVRSMRESGFSVMCGETDEERHNRWCWNHTADGWMFGEKFDPVAKTHPNLRSWAALPADVKAKIRIFNHMAHAGAMIERLQG